MNTLVNVVGFFAAAWLAWFFFTEVNAPVVGFLCMGLTMLMVASTWAGIQEDMGNI